MPAGEDGSSLVEAREKNDHGMIVNLAAPLEQFFAQVLIKRLCKVLSLESSFSTQNSAQAAHPLNVRGALYKVDGFE